MLYQGEIVPSGRVGLTLIRSSGERTVLAAKPEAWPVRPFTRADVFRHGWPQDGLPEEVNQWRLRNLGNLWRGVRKVAAARALARYTDVVPLFGQLYLDVVRADGAVLPLGLASVRVVTTAGVNYIATRLFDGNTSIGNFDFHGFGVGTTAEAIGDTALVTEETTQYVVDNTRPTGTPTNPSGNVYQSVGTYSPDSGTSPRPITEHGLFSASSAGTLLDRSVFSVVNLVTGTPGDSLQATYQLTLPAGG